jgi:hypothetical protein
MFHIIVMEKNGMVLAEMNEGDYESFIIKCYNFREDNSLDMIRVSHTDRHGKASVLTTETLNEMIDTWLDPGFLFTLGYPLQH